MGPDLNEAIERLVKFRHEFALGMIEGRYCDTVYAVHMGDPAREAECRLSDIATVLDALTDKGA